MAPFNLPWGLFLLYLASTAGIFALAEILLRSKKWKELAELYFLWNEQKSEDKKNLSNSES